MLDLREASLVEHVRLSDIGSEQLMEALAIGPVACAQNQYGLATRREDDALLHLCGEHGVAFVPFNSIGAAVAGAVPGTADPDHLEENIAAGALRLTEEEVARLSLSGL